MDPKKKRLEDLLRLAEDQKGKPEGILAARIAAKLQAELDSRPKKKTTKKKTTKKKATKKRKKNPKPPEAEPNKPGEHHYCEGLTCQVVVVESNHKWRKYLLAGLAEHLCCYVDKCKGAKKEYRIFGHTSDVDRLCLVYGDIEEQVLDRLEIYMKSLPGHRRRAERNDYLISLVVGLIDNWRESREQYHQSTKDYFASKTACSRAYFDVFEPGRRRRPEKVDVNNSEGYQDGWHVY